VLLLRCDREKRIEDEVVGNMCDQNQNLERDPEIPSYENRFLDIHIIVSEQGNNSFEKES